MIADSKKVAVDILDKMVPKVEAEGEPTTEAGEDVPDVGLDAVSDDLLSALKGGDSKGVASALRAAFELLRNEE